MRAKVHLTNLNDHTLHFDHQYYLASALYKKLNEAEPELAEKLHRRNGPKFHTFSWVIPEDRVKSKNTGLSFRNAHFFISCPDADYIKGFAEGLLMGSVLRVGDVDLLVDSIEILEDVRFNESAVFHTLSPVYLKTRVGSSEELKEKDLYPNDGKFYDNIRRNLVKKYEDFYGKDFDDIFFNAEVKGGFKAKRMKIKGNYHRASLMKIEINAPSELLKFAYDAGLGEKTAMGFGFVTKN